MPNNYNIILYSVWLDSYTPTLNKTKQLDLTKNNLIKSNNLNFLSIFIFYSVDLRFFNYDGLFFLFLPKWGSFNKNYKFRQVVPIRHDFICRSRPN